MLQQTGGNVSIISGKLQKGWLFTLISLIILKALKTGYVQTVSNMNLKHLFYEEHEAETISANILLLRGHFAYCIATNMTPGSSCMNQKKARENIIWLLMRIILGLPSSKLFVQNIHILSLRMLLFSDASAGRGHSSIREYTS